MLAASKREPGHEHGHQPIGVEQFAHPVERERDREHEPVDQPARPGDPVRAVGPEGAALAQRADSGGRQPAGERPDGDRHGDVEEEADREPVDDPRGDDRGGPKAAPRARTGPPGRRWRPPRCAVTAAAPRPRPRSAPRARGRRRAPGRSGRGPRRAAPTPTGQVRGRGEANAAIAAIVAGIPTISRSPISRHDERATRRSTATPAPNTETIRATSHTSRSSEWSANGLRCPAPVSPRTSERARPARR